MSRRLPALLAVASLPVFTVYHFHRTHSLPITRQPPNFVALASSNPAAASALYARHLDVPIPSLKHAANAVFASTPYALELALSGAPTYDPRISHMTVPGEKWGFLTVESRPSENEVIYRYSAEDIDFQMYIATPALINGAGRRDLLIGFVDKTGDWSRNLGSRVYLRVLCEAAARKLDVLHNHPLLA
ncbi:hypothetical protein BDZ88DRAFT_407360 [Geranomyces variabilis]|nr:hypothetical protein BDZ88DRAFT_407360 [Geranomyces variabilis]